MCVEELIQKLEELVKRNQELKTAEVEIETLGSPSIIKENVGDYHYRVVIR